MMPVRFGDDQPVDGGQPLVLVAVQYTPEGPVATVRNDVRWLADEGWLGIWLPEADDPLAEVAKDAARRAGLAVVTAPGAFADENHVLGIEPNAVAVDSAVDAFERCFAGQRVIVGHESAVDGLRQFLELAEAAGSWPARPAPAGWVSRGNEAEQAWFSTQGAELVIDIPTGFPGAVHLVDPELGDILGLVTPLPGEPFVIREHGEPLAIYCGPNRYEFDDYVTRAGF